MLWFECLLMMFVRWKFKVLKLNMWVQLFIIVLVVSFVLLQIFIGLRGLQFLGVGMILVLLQIVEEFVKMRYLMLEFFIVFKRLQVIVMLFLQSVLGFWVLILILGLVVRWKIILMFLMVFFMVLRLIMLFFMNLKCLLLSQCFMLFKFLVFRLFRILILQLFFISLLMRWELIKLVLFVIRIFMCIIIYVVIEVMLLNFGKSFFYFNV